MNTFSYSEQKATLQCVWQLLQANPSNEEMDFVEQQTANWNICNNPSECSFVERLMLQKTRQDYSKEWIAFAVLMDPYKAFQVVSDMPDMKKKMFKSFILSIVEFKGNDLKTAMAVSLFDQTNIPYTIAGRDWLNSDSDNSSKNRII